MNAITDRLLVNLAGVIGTILMIIWLNNYSVPWAPVITAAVLSGIGVSSIVRRFLAS